MYLHQWRLCLSAPPALETPESGALASAASGNPDTHSLLYWLFVERMKKYTCFNEGNPPWWWRLREPAPLCLTYLNTCSHEHKNHSGRHLARRVPRAVPPVLCNAWGTDSHWQNREWMCTFTAPGSQTVPSLDPRTYYCLVFVVIVMPLVSLWLSLIFALG